MKANKKKIDAQEWAKMVNQCVNQLSEFSDAVQILVCRENDEKTEDYFRGEGNWYARVGMAREFISRDRVELQADAVREKFQEDDDEE